MAPGSSWEEDTAPTPRIVSARRRANLVWLVGAVAALLAAVGISLLGERDDTGARALELEVQRIASAIDLAAKGAKVQADGIAGTPMVRSAIVTDAATMIDISRTEVRFSRNAGETLEIFQLRGDQVTTLLRLPEHGTPVKLVRGREKRLENSGGGGLDVVSGAPITPQDPAEGVSGQIALSVPVDLAASRRQLATITHHAALLGVGEPLVLVDGNASAGTTITMPVHLDESWKRPSLTLSATLRGSEPRWFAPARYTAIGLGAAMLVLFLFGLRRPAGR